MNLEALGIPVAQVADVRAAATGWLLAPQGAAVANVANSQGNRIVSMLRHHRNAAEEYIWEGMRLSGNQAGEFDNTVLGAAGLTHASVDDAITFNSGFRALFVRLVDTQSYRASSISPLAIRLCVSCCFVQHMLRENKFCED